MLRCTDAQPDCLRGDGGGGRAFRDGMGAAATLSLSDASSVGRGERVAIRRRRGVVSSFRLLVFPPLGCVRDKSGAHKPSTQVGCITDNIYGLDSR